MIRLCRRLGLDLLAATWAVCLAGLLFAFLAQPLGAEEVVLVSGKRLEPQRVEILRDGSRDTGIRATFEVTGGTTQATYAFARLERRALFALLERLLISGGEQGSAGRQADAKALVRIGDIARQIGAVEDAALYFVRAGALSPALGALRDERLEAIRRERARSLLLALERDLRAGKRADVVARAAAFESGALPVPLSAVERMRMDALVRMAQRGLPSKAQAPLPLAALPAPAAPPAPLPVAPAAVQKRLAAARVHHDAAAPSLAKAADPGVSNRAARRLLEQAARHLLQARRELIRGAGPVAPQVAQAASAVTDELIDAYLQVGELLRQERRFGEARRWLRAVVVLDPENPRAIELGIRIEDDLHAPQGPDADPYYDADPFSHYFVGSYFGSPYFSRSYLRGFGSYRYLGHGHLHGGHSHRGLRFHGSGHYRLFGSTRAGSGGSRRSVGTRR